MVLCSFLDGTLVQGFLKDFFLLLIVSEENSYGQGPSHRILLVRPAHWWNKVYYCLYSELEGGGTQERHRAQEKHAQCPLWTWLSAYKDIRLVRHSGH